MYFLCFYLDVTDGATHQHSAVEPDDDAFGDFLSGMPGATVSQPGATVSLQSTVPSAAASTAEADAHIPDSSDGGGPAAVKQKQTGDNCCD